MILDPHAIPLKVFVFDVESPHLSPKRATLEIEAPDLLTAEQLLRDMMPGLFVHGLVNEYWKHLEGGTA